MPSTPSDPDDDLLTPREVASLAGVTVTTVSRWARAEILKAFALTPGGQRRYRRAGDWRRTR
ncbi:MAG: helix-turn-helix domain-containing protein [Actinoallomurus sp.]